MSEYKAETVWESEGKTLDGKPFLSVKKARGYYYYAERGGVDSIFFILFDQNTGKFALITESKPGLDEAVEASAMATTAFGGSIDSNLSIIDLVKQEVKEEAGYIIEDEDIMQVGLSFVSSQMNQVAHGFLVNVTNIEKTEQTEAEHPDASEEFSKNTVDWLTYDEVMQNSDWKSIFIVSKVMHAAKQRENKAQIEEVDHTEEHN